MPLLKAKINRVLQRQDAIAQNIKLEEIGQPLSPSSATTKSSVKEENVLTIKTEQKSTIKQESPKKANSSVMKLPRKKEPQSNKNIVKNYARAMINFATSTMASPFLKKIHEKDSFDMQNFKRFIKGQKEDINSIKKLRELLLIGEEDTVRTAAMKRAFKHVSEIFIKFFSVNWVFNSKVNNKVLHLSYRFKILRRVRNPEYFTYLENFSKTK